MNSTFISQFCVTPNRAMAKTKRPKSWTSFLVGSDPTRRVYLTGLKGVLIGLAISLVLTSGLLGPATAQRTQQQKQGPTYTTSSNDEKIPTAQYDLYDSFNSFLFSSMAFTHTHLFLKCMLCLK